jgi:hypothetical protein
MTVKRNFRKFKVVRDLTTTVKQGFGSSKNENKTWLVIYDSIII